jgi:diguanylate cyclase (GGDEF)-like protein
VATAVVPKPEAATPRVLIVEDDPDWALLVGEILRHTDTEAFEASTVNRLADARDELLKGGVDCVLLDLSLPDASGLDALFELEGIAPSVPVVILSGLDDEAVALRAVQSGAQDYLLKSHAEPAILARAVRYAIERKRSEVELAYRALHDGLTGLPNRSFFFDRLDLALSRSARSGHRGAVLFLDLDGFKRINDTHGHAVGDRLLSEVAGRLLRTIRPTDTLARFGGDEFILLCEDMAEAGQAVALAERLGALCRKPFDIDGTTVAVGLSIGIVFVRGGGGVTAEGLIHDADKMMYRAKRQSSGYHLLEDAD